MMPDIDKTTDKPDELASEEQAISEEQLRSLISEAVPSELGITPMKNGFKMNLSANPGFHKVFFSARCDCKTAALLSVEVSEKKTPQEVRQAIPALISKLEAQAKTFYSMPCEAHTRMRLGPAAGIAKSSGGS